MKVQTYHLFEPLLRFHRMRKPRKSNPSLMWTTWVLAGDSRSPSGASTAATSSRSASVCERVPFTKITKSTAYAEYRIMPTGRRVAWAGSGVRREARHKPARVSVTWLTDVDDRFTPDRR